MRFSGPRMIYSHPLLALAHILDGRIRVSRHHICVAQYLLSFLHLPSLYVASLPHIRAIDVRYTSGLEAKKKGKFFELKEALLLLLAGSQPSSLAQPNQIVEELSS